MTVVAAALALVALGLVLRLPARGIGAMLALLWGAVLLAHLILPAGHPLLLAIGGTWQGWLVLGGLGGLALAYRTVLGRLRTRGAAVALPAAQAGPFTPTELERYARHIVLREVGGAGQRKLKGARVLVIGAGGLGSPVLLYLAAAGVGHVTVIDDDRVENSNLQRQIIHRDAGIGLPKAASAREAMLALNPFMTVEAVVARLDAGRAAELFARHDLILDGSDNFVTRYLANAAAVAAGKPLVAGAIAQWEGQVSLYHPAAGGPCFACIFPEAPADGLAPACAEAGVVGALPGVIGSMMAVEAIKAITGAGAALRGRMLIYDALYAENRVVGLKRRAGCTVCGGVTALEVRA